MIFSKKSFFETIAFFSVIGLLSFIFFKDNITLFPSFVHAWTQSDRYALALGFLNNGFDFFHPQTYNLVSINGITQVDFPVHEYAVALLMKLSGIHEPVIFRLYTLCYGTLGLFFLFRLVKLLGGNFFHGLFVSVFMMTCPVFAYYLDGFLPSIPSFANVIMGYYFFFRYKKTVVERDFVLAIIFFTLAALARTPFAIFLFAAFCQQALEYLRIKKINRREVLLFTSGLGIILAYFFYNLHLAAKYGTQFLTYLMPAKSISDFGELFFRVIDQWKYDYFTKAHYLTILFLFVLTAFLVLRKIFNSENRFVGVQILVALSGAVLYFILMTVQFPEHDYYFIDSFYPVIILALIYFITKIQPKTFIYKSLFLITTGGLAYFFCTSAISSLHERYTFHEWDRTEITRQNFTGAEHFLDSIGITKTAKMLVLDAYSTNTPLILMNRKGYTLLWTSKAKVDTFLEKDFDYVVMQNCFLASDIVHFNPGIIRQLEKVADNGTISIYKKQKKENRSMEEFLGMVEKNVLFRCFNNFEEDNLCPGVVFSKRSSENKFEGSFSCLVDSTEEFSPSFTFSKKEIPFTNSTRIFVKAMVLREEIGKDIDVVVSLNHGDENYFYRNFSLKQYTGNISDWREIMFQFVLPDIKSDDDKLSLYFWNKNKGRFRLDDFALTIYH